MAGYLASSSLRGKDFERDAAKRSSDGFSVAKADEKRRGMRRDLDNEGSMMK